MGRKIRQKQTIFLTNHMEIHQKTVSEFQSQKLDGKSSKYEPKKDNKNAQIKAQPTAAFSGAQQKGNVKSAKEAPTSNTSVWETNKEDLKEHSTEFDAILEARRQRRMNASNLTNASIENPLVKLNRVRELLQTHDATYATPVEHCKGLKEHFSADKANSAAQGGNAAKDRITLHAVQQKYKNNVKENLPADKAISAAQRGYAAQQSAKNKNNVNCAKEQMSPMQTQEALHEVQPETIPKKIKPIYKKAGAWIRIKSNKSQTSRKPYKKTCKETGAAGQVAIPSAEIQTKFETPAAEKERILNDGKKKMTQAKEEVGTTQNINVASNLEKQTYEKLPWASRFMSKRKLVALPKSFAAAKTVHEMTSRDFHADARAHISVAQQLLKDHRLIKLFKNAILHNRHLFKDRIVLEVGCNVGLLSLFAASAGAKCVYAIDSSRITDYAREVVQASRYADKIHVLHGNIKNIKLPTTEVDIIVSDWTGYSLLYQSKCEEIIYARDKWLNKQTGLIFPDKAVLYMVAVEDSKTKNERVEWWNTVYNFDFRCIRESTLETPVFKTFKAEQVVSKIVEILRINLHTATLQDLKVRTKFYMQFVEPTRVDGIATFFKVTFTKLHKNMCFSTDPWSIPTRWMQTLFLFDKHLTVNRMEPFFGAIEMKPIGKQNKYDHIQVSFELYSGEPKSPELETEMVWNMNQC